MELKSALLIMLWLLEHYCLNNHSSNAIIHLSITHWSFLMLQMFAHVQANIGMQIRVISSASREVFFSSHVQTFSLFAVPWLLSRVNVEWVFSEGSGSSPGAGRQVFNTKKNLKTVAYPVRVLSCYLPPLNAACLGFFALLLLRSLIKTCKQVNRCDSLKWGIV